MKYEPGDILVIQPQNDYNLCKKISNLLKLDFNSFIKFESNQGFNFPNIISIKELFINWLNLSSFPSRYFIRIMFHFCENNEIHKEKLEEMCSKTKDGIENYYEYCVRERRNIYEILFDFQSVSIPLEYFLEGIGLQKPREFSISSSYLENPNLV